MDIIKYGDSNNTYFRGLISWLSNISLEKKFISLIKKVLGQFHVYQDKDYKEKICVVSKEILNPTEINNHNNSVDYHPKMF